MPWCLNTKQHRCSTFHEVKQLLIMLLSCIYVQDKFLSWLFFLQCSSWKQGERMAIPMVKKNSKPFSWLQSLPPSPAFSKEDSSYSSHVCSAQWLLYQIPIPCRSQPWCYAAFAGCLQGVPGPLVPAGTSHRHVVLMEVDCCASVSNTHNEISIWIVLIKLPVALNPGSIRCKWITINFAPFLRAVYMHGQHSKNHSGYSQGSLSLTMTWNFWEWRNHRSIFYKKNFI